MTVYKLNLQNSLARQRVREMEVWVTLGARGGVAGRHTQGGQWWTSRPGSSSRWLQNDDTLLHIDFMCREDHTVALHQIYNFNTTCFDQGPRHCEWRALCL